MIVYRGWDSPQVRALYARGILFAALGAMALGIFVMARFFFVL
jgi:hypothetical protein